MGGFFFLASIVWRLSGPLHFGYSGVWGGKIYGYGYGYGLGWAGLGWDASFFPSAVLFLIPTSTLYIHSSIALPATFTPSDLLDVLLEARILAMESSFPRWQRKAQPTNVQRPRE